MSEVTVSFKRGDDWVPMSLDVGMPLRHFCHLFSNSVPVVAKQSGTYIVNSEDLQKQYRVKRRKAITFADVLTKAGDKLDRPLQEVGFL